MQKIILYLVFSLPAILLGQPNTDDRLPVKVSHAEPLYIDMIRDLGARKGERELNVGWKLNDNQNYREQSAFVEYEFSPINRLGLEIEIPVNYHYSAKPYYTEMVPNTRIQSIKPAMQYTFLVSAKHRLSMAAGAIYELQLHSFKTISSKNDWIKGNAFNPFFIIAKRLGRQFHSLLYAGPVCQFSRYSLNNTVLQANFSVHYVFPGSGHFIGAELNYEACAAYIKTILRPQVKLRFSNTSALGIVTGIPLNDGGQNLDFMLRFIYEPARK